tara:strand:- start:61 stop:831 length:771 start_codon:yes stop_codon:yes gene_type:complete
LESDLALTLDKSPYSLRGEIQIPPGIKVVMEPGVELINAGDDNWNKFALAGSFSAVGTKEQPVVLKNITISGSSVATEKSTVTITHAIIKNGSIIPYRNKFENSKLEIADSFLETGLIMGGQVIIRRSIIKGYDTYQNGDTEIEGNNIELVNNCFSVGGPRIDSPFEDRIIKHIIKHNTFNASNPPQKLQYPVWFMIWDYTSTYNPSITDNYWHGLGDTQISDFLWDGSTRMDISAKFITSPLLTEPHPDTPTCIN